jgi:hypothetical protein
MKDIIPGDHVTLLTRKFLPSSGVKLPEAPAVSHSGIPRSLEKLFFPGVA